MARKWSAITAKRYYGKKSIQLDMGKARGIDNITSDMSLTINSVTKNPDFCYRGQDMPAPPASGSNPRATSWAPFGGYGLTINEYYAGTGDAFAEDQDTVFTEDLGALFTAGTSKFYVGGAATSYDSAATDDMVAEIAFRASDTGGPFIGVGDNTTGWRIQHDSTNQCMNLFQEYLNDAPTTIDFDSTAGTIINGTYNHVMLFLDRSGNASWYINSVHAGRSDVSNATNQSYATGLALGNPTSSGATTLINLLLIAQWSGSGWLDTDLQEQIARDRYSQLIQAVPLFGDGTLVPEVI